MNDKTPGPVGKGTARRRLIRGMFAAPAVLPLYSGAQVAVASNRRCIQNEASAGAAPEAAAAADTWIRVRLWTLSKMDGPNLRIDSTWVKGSDVAALLATQPQTSTYYLSEYTYQCFSATKSSPENSTYTAGDLLSTGEPASNGYTLSQNGSWVAVRVDTNGNIIGVVDVGTGGGAVHHSCWTSFKAG